MALIFSRLAHNFIKNGYFPTDEVTLERILSALDIAAGRVRIFDPCCGEGVALADVKHHLSECGAAVAALGVEFDPERAWHAKGLLDTVAHADVNDVFVTARSIGLLFLNPPYGAVVSDKAGTGDDAKRERLEKIFYRKTVPWLQFGGVMVLIVPHYVLDAEFAAMIARHFERVTIHMAPEQRFKQCVVMGVKRRTDSPDLTITKALEAAGRGELPPELPDGWCGEPYLVPAMTSEDGFAFTSMRIDRDQLAAEVARLAPYTLWTQFRAMFGSITLPARRPLRDLSKWHLALALAAGQIAGVVRSDSRTLLIKGDTFKEKARTVDQEFTKDGNVVETITMTDTFVPVIRGLDFTPGPGFGQVVTVR
jgi:hypothetical protein